MGSKIVNSIEDINILDRNNWFCISKNYRLSETFIETHSREFYWDIICKHQKLSESFLEKHIDIIYWDEISRCQILSEEFILKHKDKLNWDYILEYQTLSEYFLEKYYLDNAWAGNLYWHTASMYQILSEEFIEKHQCKVCWVPITLYQNLSESLIEKFYDTKIDKESLFLMQNLSEEFIEKHLYDVIKYPNFFRGQNLSESFIEKHYDDLFYDKSNLYLYNLSHRVMTDEERLEDITSYAEKYKLEFDGKYLYAYRNHNVFGRGMWKNYLSYEVGKYYRDWHCNMDIDEPNSFGLGIFPEGNTKVKVSIDDWGLHLKRGDGKCRVWGFTVLEQN